MLKNLKLDAFGMGASIICAIHCAAIPFLVSIAATTGLTFLQSHWFEFGILSLAIVFVLASLVPSFKKHKNAFPLVAAVIGLSMVFLNHWIWGHESYVMSFIGAIIITIAHYRNYKLLRISSEA